MESTSIVKALALLEAVASEPTGRSLGSLASEVHLTKPTAHRILKTLTQLGYLERGENGTYRQAPGVQRLVSNDRLEQLLSAAGPVLRDLHETTRETVNLGVLRHHLVVYLQVLESPLPLRRVATPNSVDPFYCTALGRAIVSHLSPAARENLIRRTSLSQLTPHTNVDRNALGEILARAARDGFALEVDETDVGVTCVAAPVLEGDVAIAAISISAPTARVTRDRLPALIRQTRKAAAQVSTELEHLRQPSSDPHSRLVRRLQPKQIRSSPSTAG
jgi:IclR family acetate operon transcriptional repressor/IclR family KDG regulon transcriptional repressor